MSTSRQPRIIHCSETVGSLGRLVEEGLPDVLDIVLGRSVAAVVFVGGSLVDVVVTESDSEIFAYIVVADSVAVGIVSGLQFIMLISNIVGSKLQVRLVVVQLYQVNASVSLVSLHQISNNMEELFSHIQSAMEIQHSYY